VEGGFGREEKGEINLKWKKDETEILIHCQSDSLVQSNIKPKVTRTSMAEIVAGMWVSSKSINDLAE
jgi:hypothetical protein